MVYNAVVWYLKVFYLCVCFFFNLICCIWVITVDLNNIFWSENRMKTQTYNNMYTRICKALYTTDDVLKPGCIFIL